MLRVKREAGSLNTQNQRQSRWPASGEQERFGGKEEKPRKTDGFSASYMLGSGSYDPEYPAEESKKKFPPHGCLRSYTFSVAGLGFEFQPA